MSAIAQKIAEIKLPDEVKLVAVSKTRPPELIMEAYHAGQRVFGENKAQELKTKYEQLPKDIEWHFIGHLQTNKVKYIAGFVHLIHSVDSFRLLKEINKKARSHNRVIHCLLQLHIAREDHKFGFSEEESKQLLGSEELKELENVKVAGLMGMATYTHDMGQIRREFRQLHELFTALKNTVTGLPNAEFKHLSMGMTGDYQIAIEEGSTIVRIGSAIFGSRN